MKKYLTTGTLALALFAIAGVGSVSASEWFGRNRINLDAETMAERQEEMFEQRADILGISVEKMKEYWAEGVRMQEIMEELGIDREDFRAEMIKNRKERQEDCMNALIEKGVITKEQAEKRLESLEERGSNRMIDNDFRQGKRGTMGGARGRIL